jgi:hypothetical protein
METALAPRMLCGKMLLLTLSWFKANSPCRSGGLVKQAIKQPNHHGPQFPQ